MPTEVSTPYPAPMGCYDEKKMKTKLKPCKACGAMFSKNASNCTTCGEPRTNWARMLLIFSVGGLLALMVWVLWVKPMLKKCGEMDEIERQIRAGGTPRVR